MAQDDNGGPGGPPPGDVGGPPPGEPGGGPGGADGPGKMGDNNGPVGTFDPAQFQQRMLVRIRESLSITNDEEWAAIQPLIQKVMEAQREASAGRGMGPGPGGFGRPGNRPDGQGRPGPQASAEQQALQKALDHSAPVAQIKDALARYRAARKDKQATLETAQNNLRAVLNTRQEAQAVLIGLLP